MAYHISYHAKQWRHYQIQRAVTGAWQIVVQDLPDKRRLRVELHRAADGVVSITDARIEYEVVGRTGKPHWHTRRTLRPDDVLFEEARPNG
jgi:hypothetical protein